MNAASKDENIYGVQRPIIFSLLEKDVRRKFNGGAFYVVCIGNRVGVTNDAYVVYPSYLAASESDYLH